MSKRQFLMIIGLWIIVFLFLGFPTHWDKIFAVVAGVLVIGISSRIRPELKQTPREHVPYVEHRTETPAQKTGDSGNIISNTTA